MRKTVIIATGSVVAVVGLMAIVVVWVSNARGGAVAASDGGAVAIDSGSSGGDSSELTANQQTVHKVIPTPTPEGENVASGTSKSSNLTVPSTSTAGQATQSNPTDFSEYDQYRDQNKYYYGDITVGTGAVAASGSKLTVQYRGWLTNGKEFDESYSKGTPFSFTVGQHQVIEGWDEGLIGMKVGGKRRLVVPPALGYGSQATGSIPAGSVLVFDIELLKAE